MGCSSSKKLDAREIRAENKNNGAVNSADLSIPLQQHPRLREDLHHVALTSSTYGIMKSCPAKKQGSEKESGGLRCSSMNRVSASVSQMYDTKKERDLAGNTTTKPRSGLNVLLSKLDFEGVEQASNRAIEKEKEPETIDTLELMAGLEDKHPESRGTASLPRGRVRRRSKSLPSFGTLGLVNEKVATPPPTSSIDSAALPKFPGIVSSDLATGCAAPAVVDVDKYTTSIERKSRLGALFAKQLRVIKRDSSSDSSPPCTSGITTEHSAQSSLSELDFTSSSASSVNKCPAMEVFHFKCSIEETGAVAEVDCSSKVKIVSNKSQRDKLKFAGSRTCSHSRHRRSVSEIRPKRRSRHVCERCKAIAFDAREHRPCEIFQDLVTSPKTESEGTDEPVFDPELIASFERALEQFAEKPWSDPNVHSNDAQVRSGARMDAKAHAASHVENNHIFLPGSPGEGCQAIDNEAPQLEKDAEKPADNSLAGFELRCPPNGERKVVLYSTSLRGIRKTYEDCRRVKVILDGLGVRVDERDVSMDAGFLQEMKKLLQKPAAVPRLFVKGRYIGGAEEVCRLHEEGRLVGLLEGMMMARRERGCDGCGGMRFVPCLFCRGSCKVVIEVGGGGCEVFRCSYCNENGLAKCPLCCPP